LNIRVTNILEEYRIDVFLGTLKDNIQYVVLLWGPDTMEKEFKLAIKFERKLWK